MTTKTPEPIMLTPKQAASMLGMHVDTLYTHVLKRQLVPVVRIGKAVRIPRAEFEAYVASLAEDWSSGAPWESTLGRHG